MPQIKDLPNELTVVDPAADFLAIDDADASFETKKIKPSNIAPKGAPTYIRRANAQGASDLYAAADHQHDGGRITTTAVSSSPHNLTNIQEVLLVDTTSGQIDIQLPAPGGEKRQWAIKKTNTGTNKIRLLQAASENIEGAAATLELPGSENTDRPAWTVITDGTDWWVL